MTKVPGSNKFISYASLESDNFVDNLPVNDVAAVIQTL
jgi:hypothetical protein